MFVDIFFAIDKNLSLGPKRSIARNFWKISCSHGDRRLWITFLSNINCDKPPGTVFKCQKGSLPITVEVIIAFLHFFRTWEVVEKTIFQKKKAFFPVRKKIWPPLSRIINCDKPQSKVYKGLQGFFTITVFVIISILWDLRGCWKVEITFFLEKKDNLS